jgi:hypothetical protein
MAELNKGGTARRDHPRSRAMSGVGRSDGAPMVRAANDQ